MYDHVVQCIFLGFLLFQMFLKVVIWINTHHNKTAFNGQHSKVYLSMLTCLKLLKFPVFFRHLWSFKLFRVYRIIDKMSLCGTHNSCSDFMVYIYPTQTKPIDEFVSNSTSQEDWSKLKQLVVFHSYTSCGSTWIMKQQNKS